MTSRMTLARHASCGYWPPSSAPIQMRATPRGPFAVTTKALPHRRTHLIDDALSLWKGGKFWRLTVQAKCGRQLSSVNVYLYAPEEHELCDSCVLADYPGPVVYRCYMGDVLVYIGCTGNLSARIASHFTASAWWPLITRTEYDVHPDIKTALEAERLAIVAEDPAFNTEHTARDTRRSRRRIAIQECAA